VATLGPGGAWRPGLGLGGHTLGLGGQVLSLGGQVLGLEGQVLGLSLEGRDPDYMSDAESMH